ncbi:MAG: XRE family transcriptional regulator [Candidatus Faecenecus gallistercoris]|nr:XRE family transcriptional regulator [Candidatus Faecenecus gallistercoris]
MENNFATNLKHLRIQSGMTQEELAKKMDKDYSTIGKWELGQRSPIMTDVIKIADIFQVSLEKLIGSSMIYDNAEVVDINSDIVKIPVYGTIKAGIPIESQSDIIDYIDIPKEWTRGDKKFYALKISGDSMFPKYSENDIVIFEQHDDKELYNGKDCAVMINGTESTFKKVLLNEQGIVLQPYNTAYDIMMYSNEQIEQLPIKVVGIAREKRTKL